VKAEFGLTIACDSLRKFISPDATLQSHRAFPMGSQRIKIAPQQVTEYFAKRFANISSAQALMVFEEVVAPTPEEDETEGDEDIEMLWRDVARHFFSVWATKTSRITFFLFHFLVILKKQTKTHSQR
jgi:hypothetical protein